jgi:hypothetical protein
MGRTQTIIQNMLDDAGERYLTPDDFTVLDAEGTYALNIKQKDIRDACAGNGGSCVAARACKRALDTDAVWVSKGYTWAWLDRDSRVIHRFRNTTAMTRNVVEPLDSGRFDDIVPGLYELRAPKGTEKLGEGARRKRKSTASKTRKVPFRKNRKVNLTSTLRVTRKAS